MHQAAGSCPSTAMVDHCRDVLKEPLVGTVAKPENVRGRGLIGAELAPASGDDGTATCLPHRLDDSGCELEGVIDHDASEADIDRGRAAVEERFDLKVWLVVGHIAEEEATDIYEVVR